MTVSRSNFRQWIVAGALAGATSLSEPSAAGATTTSFEVADQVVVQVIGRAAAITIRTWDRKTVQVDWPEGQPFETSRGAQETRSNFLIPTVTVTEYTTPAGPVTAKLPPEDFPAPNLAAGTHDVVRIIESGPPPAPGKTAPSNTLTVTIPESAGLVNVRSGRGTIVLSGYHGTTIAVIGHGRIELRNVSGDAFVQALNGRFYAFDSDFDRLRIRSNHADEVFDGCRVKQIEATTLTGNILFDNGVFNPGLARFGSDRGSIAVGVNGGAQLGAHVQNGHVLTVLPQATSPQPVFGPSASDPDTGDLQVVGGGGPVVNASSVRGNILLYDGSLADRRPATMTVEWQAMNSLLLATRAAARGR